MLRYVVGLPIAFKLGLDLGNLAVPLQNHYIGDERERKTDVWNAVGNDLVTHVESSPPVREQADGTAARVEVSDVLSLSKSNLKWQFLTHCPPEDDKEESLWDKINNFRLVMASEELQLKVPLKVRRKGVSSHVSLVVDTHNDGRGWKVDRAWVETQGEGAVCAPLPTSFASSEKN